MDDTLLPVRTPAGELDLPLGGDGFFRSLAGHLTGTLQDVVGRDETEAFLSVVGQALVERADEMYREALRLPVLDAGTVSDVLAEAIARGDDGCRIVVSLKPHEQDGAPGREYFRAGRRGSEVPIS